MKQIIKGKKYDTDTARLLAERTYSNRRDFGYVHEELYIKRTGEYFIYGEGGVASKYRKWIDSNSWTGTEKLTPITEQEAREWVEHYANDQYEDIFGTVEEDGTMRICTYSLPAYLHEKLKKEGVRRGIAASQVLAELIESM